MRSPEKLCIIAAVTLCCINARGGATIAPVLIAGQPAIGLPNYKYGAIEDIDLHDTGRISVKTHLSYPGQTLPALGIWSGSVGDLRLEVYDQMQAPGLPAGWTLSGMDVGTHGITNDGQIAFGALLQGRPSMWVGPMGAPALIARVDGPAYGVPGATYANSTTDGFNQHLRSFSLPSFGRVAFASRMQGPGIDSTNDFGLWEGPISSPALLFREGQQAPGLPDSVVFDFFGRAAPSSNGSISFETRLRGPGIDSINGYARYSGSISNPKVLFRNGIPAPGTAPGVTFNEARNTSITPNEAGNHILIASLSGPDVNPNNDVGFWFGNGDSLQLVAREGSQAPGLPTGTLFATDTSSWLFTNPHFNNRSEVIFSAHYSGNGTEGYGLWAGPVGNLKLIAKVGDQIPGYPSTVRFGGLVFPGSGDFFGDLRINENGQVAFTAKLNTGHTGLFATDEGGNIITITSTGNMLPLGDGQEAMITGFAVEGLDFNNQNQLAFIAALSNRGFSAFIADVPEPNVPEPTSLLLVSASLLLIQRRRTQ